METKFKIGDKVEIISPKEIEGTCWVRGMERNIGKISRIKYIYSASADLENIGFTYPLSSLRLVEEEAEQPTEQPTEQVTEQVAEQVTNPIDWEQRRWDLYKMLLMHYSQHSVREALNAADRCIEIYKQKLK